MEQARRLAIWGAISVVLGLSSVPAQAAPTVPITMYRGEWSPSGKYLPGTVVTYNGGSWLCVSRCSGQTPGQDQTKWISLGGGSSQQASGGIKVYDAKGQFLGYSVSPDLYGGLIYDSRLGLNYRAWGPTYDQENNLDIAHARIISNIAVTRYYATEDCSEGPLIDGPLPLQASNFLTPVKDQYGYLTPGEYHTGTSVVRSLIEYVANCTDGEWYQASPAATKQCVKPGQLITSFSETPVENLSGPTTACQEHGLTPPCYSCFSQTARVFINGAGLQKTQFTPVTLPFTLPIALPLRYEAPK